MPTNLQPLSTVSAVVLPATGSPGDVSAALAYNIYTTNAFYSGASDQVSYTYNKLGGNVLDLEIMPSTVYNAYEEACLEYSYLINTHQAKNVLSTLLGNSTGSFDEDGELATYVGGTGSTPNLNYPRFQLDYINHVGQGVAGRAGLAGNQTIYSASFTTEASIQDYDLQAIIYTASLDATSPFHAKVGKKTITVQKVYYKTPRAMWNFYGGYAIGAVGNLSTYGMYADDSNFQVVPAWQNILQAYAFEEDMHVRASHWSFKLINNKIRIFPMPRYGDNYKFWVDFKTSEEPFDEDPDRKYGAEGVNNMNTLPFPNIPYKNINSIGKQWIRRFALSLSKETLGQVRSKLASIPIPGNDVTLNGPALVSEAKEEQVSLRDELKEVLDQMVYASLAEQDAKLQNSITEVALKVPTGIYVG